MYKRNSERKKPVTETGIWVINELPLVLLSRTAFLKVSEEDQVFKSSVDFIKVLPYLSIDLCSSRKSDPPQQHALNRERPFRVFRQKSCQLLAQNE